MTVKGTYVEMAIEEMRHYEPNNPKLIRKQELNAEAAVEELQKVTESTRMQYYHAQVSEIIEEYYDIGKLLDVYQIFGGYVNTTFGIYTEKDGEKYTWCVRKYRRGKTEEAIKFEHKLLNHAFDNGYKLCAVPVVNKDGNTYVSESVEYAEGEEDFYFAVFSYIAGDVLYDWMPNWAEENFSNTTLECAAKAMAQFHSANVDFKSDGLIGDNIFGANEDMRVNELIATFPARMHEWGSYLKSVGFENKYMEYFETYFDFYVEASKQATIPEEAYKDMVITACHLDFHGGNFKYFADGTISGSFDYDMAMVDSRLFDLALGMHYTFASWKLHRDGELCIDRVKRFVEVYNETCKEIGRIEPFNQTEKDYFFEAMVQAPIYVYGWSNGAIYANQDVDPFEYLYYAQHFQHAIEWLQDNEDEVRAMAKNFQDTGIIYFDD